MVTQEFAINTAKSFIEECQLSGLFFRKAYLFGSFANGSFHKWSVLDLLLISDQFNDNVFVHLKTLFKN